MGNTSIRLGSVEPLVNEALAAGKFDNVSEMVRHCVMHWSHAEKLNEIEEKYLVELVLKSRQKGGYTTFTREEFREFMIDES